MAGRVGDVGEGSLDEVVVVDGIPAEGADEAVGVVEAG